MQKNIITVFNLTKNLQKISFKYQILFCLNKNENYNINLK